MSRIFIGIPCYQNPAPEVLEDYMLFAYALGRRYQDHEFFLGIKTKTEQFRARNAIVEAAATVCADYVFMLDDDQIINIDGGNDVSDRYNFLHKLIGHHEAIPEAGIIGGLYFHRGGDCRPVLLNKQGNGYVYLRDDEIKHELQEVSVQGGGCMLIKMKVFDQIGYSPFEPEHEYGTDFQVCIKAAEKGFKVYSDTSIELGHLKNQRDIVTSRNRHMHYAQTVSTDFDNKCSYEMSRILTEFRDDVKEYIGVETDAELIEIANQYGEHSAKFNEYRESGDLRQYYIDSGYSYLARACFIRSTDNPHQFDNYVLQMVKRDIPGVGLDFGCGAAPITFDYARKGHVIHFYDIPGSKPYEFLKWRARKYNIYGTKAIFQKDFPDPGTCDYALFLDSIEHLTDWESILKKASISLKHAGCLISNFMLLEDNENKEHIFMDKPKFMEYMTRLKLWPINPAVFQKREDFNGDTEKGITG